MIAFQRLSTGPTLPDLIRREADRRARRSLRMLPPEVWLRPATAAVFWQHRNNGLVQGSGGHGGKLGRSRLDSELGHIRARVTDAAPRHCPARMREKALTRLSRAAQADLPALTFRSWWYQTGMTVCFAGANGVLAAARLLSWCCLLSPDSIGVAMAGADRLTKTGMRLWRTNRATRQT